MQPVARINSSFFMIFLEKYCQKEKCPPFIAVLTHHDCSCHDLRCVHECESVWTASVFPSETPDFAGSYPCLRQFEFFLNRGFNLCVRKD